TIEKLVRQADHKNELVAFLQQQGFRSILARMDVKGEVQAPVPATSYAEKMLENIPQAGDVPHGEMLARAKQEYELIQDEKRLAGWVQTARNTGYLAIDTETTSLTPSTTTLVGISLAITPGKACYIPVNHVDPKTPMVATGGFAFENAATPKQIPIKKI